MIIYFDNLYLQDYLKEKFTLDFSFHLLIQVGHLMSEFYC